MQTRGQAVPPRSNPMVTMTATPDFKDLLARADYDAIEDAWMACLDKDLDSIDDLIQVAQGMARAGETTRVSYLLELLDEQLEASERFRDRLALLRETSKWFVAPKKLHPVLVKTLGRVYQGHVSLELMADKVGLHRAKDDVPKLWKKVERLETLLAFDIGTIVHMKGKGAGRVTDINMALESFKVELEGHPSSLQVRFHGAAKLLELLPPEHVLRRKIEDLEELQRLAKEQPADLLQLVLESFDGPLTSAEIRQAVTGIIAEARWTAWWNAARKHPQVVVSTKGRHNYSWATSSADAHSTVWKRFQSVDPRGKLDMLRREGHRDQDLKRRMSEALISLAATSYQEDPSLACEIWFGLNRSGFLPQEEISWSPLQLLATLEDPQPIFQGIQDRQQRERAYLLAQEELEHWPALFARLLVHEDDPRSLDLLAEHLERADPSALDSFIDKLLSQPRKAPAGFVWLAERTAERETWQTRNPLRLLQQILRALNSEAFATFKQRLNALVESGQTVPRLLPHLSLEQAGKALQAIDTATGLASYEREPLINALYLKFPSLRPEEDLVLYATTASIATKKAELRELAEVDIPANRRAIEEARELGDLRENFEYKSARQRHEYLSARASALNQDLIRARPIDPSQVSGQEVIIGCRLQLESEDSEQRSLTLLGPWESQPEEGILSYQSELAKKLLGLELDGTVEIEKKTFRIVNIQPYDTK